MMNAFLLLRRGEYFFYKRDDPQEAKKPRGPEERERLPHSRFVAESELDEVVEGEGAAGLF